MFANNGFKIRGWDETGLHVGSACQFGGSIGEEVEKEFYLLMPHMKAEIIEDNWLNLLTKLEIVLSDGNEADVDEGCYATLIFL